MYLILISNVLHMQRMNKMLVILYMQVLCVYFAFSQPHTCILVAYISGGSVHTVKTTVILTAMAMKQRNGLSKNTFCSPYS